MLIKLLGNVFLTNSAKAEELGSELDIAESVAQSLCAMSLAVAVVQPKSAAKRKANATAQ